MGGGYHKVNWRIFILKRKLFAFLLPVVAISALVRSGFSTWYFNNYQTTNLGTNITVDITDAVSGVSTFALTTGSVTPTKLTLDQGIQEMADENYENRGIKISGVIGEETKDLAEDASIGAIFTAKSETDFNTLIAAGYNVKLTQTI